MKGGWKVFWLFAAVFAAAFGAEHAFVPDVVPVGFASEPQPLWTVETAFVLRAMELMSGSVALAAFVLMLGAWAMQFSGAQKN